MAKRLRPLIVTGPADAMPTIVAMEAVGNTAQLSGWEAVVEAWSELPEPVRAGIVAKVKAAKP